MEIHQDTVAGNPVPGLLLLYHTLRGQPVHDGFLCPVRAYLRPCVLRVKLSVSRGHAGAHEQGAPDIVCVRMFRYTAFSCLPDGNMESGQVTSLPKAPCVSIMLLAGHTPRRRI